MFAFNKIYYYLCVNPINLEVEYLVLGRETRDKLDFPVFLLAKVNVFNRK